jgi:DNA ligase 1
MKAFAQLFTALDSTTSTRAKVDALAAYFSQTPATDAAWGLYFLAGGKPRQTVPTALIKRCAQGLAQLPDWLFEESYAVVGDLAETVAHVVPPAPVEVALPLHHWVEERLLPLKGRPAEEIELALVSYWMELGTAERFLLTKLIGGHFRVGVARNLVVRALAQSSGLDAKLLAQRMMGYTDKSQLPTAQRYHQLLLPEGTHENHCNPYPFFLAHPLQVEPHTTLGAPQDWLVEWKWDGIRAQLVCRAGQYGLWSRGEELLNERFPEFAALAQALPNTCVLDGEILVWRGAHVQPFAELQKRIGRKNVTPQILAQLPVVFMAYDVLELGGQDCRTQPQHLRRQQLEQLAAAHPHPLMSCSPVVPATDWHELATLRQEARARGVEGFMLKHGQSQYGVGRTKDVGTWWKWKLEPLTVDAVLIYAQSGHGRRANLYSDYTFAVWDQARNNDETSAPTRRLVPFAKAYSGLTDEEMRLVDQRIRKTTTERFGPVRSVTPTLVVELAFEGIQASARHKSGLAVRFPRMLRLRWDKPVEDADTLSTLQALLPAPTS